MTTSSHAPVASVKVTIPGPLRARVGNQRSVSATGRTVREIIETLDQTYPGLRFDLCDETGEPREFVNLFVGQEEIRHLRGLETTVESGQTVHILLSVAGGDH